MQEMLSDHQTVHSSRQFYLFKNATIMYRLFCSPLPHPRLGPLHGTYPFLGLRAKVPPFQNGMIASITKLAFLLAAHCCCLTCMVVQVLLSLSHTLGCQLSCVPHGSRSPAGNVQCITRAILRVSLPVYTERSDCHLTLTVLQYLDHSMHPSMHTAVLHACSSFAIGCLLERPF